MSLIHKVRILVLSTLTTLTGKQPVDSKADVEQELTLGHVL